MVVAVSTSLQFGSAGKFDSRKETISVANVIGLSTADGSTAVLEAVNHFMMVVMASMIGKNIYGVLLDLLSKKKSKRENVGVAAHLTRNTAPPLP